MVGHFDPGRFEQVLAVQHDASAGVVRHRVQLAVVRAGLEQALQEIVAAECLTLVGQVGDGAGGLERLGLRVAELHDVGAVAPRQGGGQLLDDPRPLLALELDLDVGVDLVELGDRVLDERVGRVAAVEPQSDRLAAPAGVGGGRGVRRRRVSGRRSVRRCGCVGRGAATLLVVVTARGDEHARRGNGGEPPRCPGPVHVLPPYWNECLTAGAG